MFKNNRGPLPFFILLSVDVSENILRPLDRLLSQFATTLNTAKKLKISETSSIITRPEAQLVGSCGGLTVQYKQLRKGKGPKICSLCGSKTRLSGSSTSLPIQPQQLASLLFRLSLEAVPPLWWFWFGFSSKCSFTSLLLSSFFDFSCPRAPMSRGVVVNGSMSKSKKQQNGTSQVLFNLLDISLISQL